MDSPYELWDYEIGNLVYAYATQGEALADVRAMIHAHGANVVRPWGLQYDDRKSPLQNIAVGEELVRLATSDASRSVAY